MRAARWLILLALFAGGCYVPYEPGPESPLWRDPPPNGLERQGEHCYMATDGSVVCKCLTRAMRETRCFDEV